VGKLHVNRINQASFAMVMTLAACANPSVPLDSGAGGGTTAGTAGSGAGGGSAGGGTTVGTGGGGPMGSWKNTTSNLANLPSECGNMTSVTVKPDEDMIIAGVAQNGLWASTDGGASWSALGTGMGSAKIINRPTQVIFDPNDKNRFWEVGIYSGGGVFETHDHGVTFTQLGMVSHCDLAAVDFTDPDRKTLLAGGHEQSKKLYRSTDAGMTWPEIGATIPETTFCTLPLMFDAKTYLVGCGGFGGGNPSIIRTEDGGATWTRVTDGGGGGAPLVASDGSIYWSTFNGGGMVRSTDQGRTWKAVVGGGVLSGVPPVELPDGRIATVAKKVIATSADHGATWIAATTPVAFDGEAVGVVYSAARKAFYAWHFTCVAGDNPVPVDAIQRYDFDYQTN